MKNKKQYTVRERIEYYENRIKAAEIRLVKLYKQLDNDQDWSERITSELRELRKKNN